MLWPSQKTLTLNMFWSSYTTPIILGLAIAIQSICVHKNWVMGGLPYSGCVVSFRAQ
jgi:hypothetical protein